MTQNDEDTELYDGYLRPNYGGMRTNDSGMGPNYGVWHQITGIKDQQIMRACKPNDRGIGLSSHITSAETCMQ